MHDDIFCGVFCWKFYVCAGFSFKKLSYLNSRYQLNWNVFASSWKLLLLSYVWWTSWWLFELSAREKILVLVTKRDQVLFAVCLKRRFWNILKGKLWCWSAILLVSSHHFMYCVRVMFLFCSVECLWHSTKSQTNVNNVTIIDLFISVSTAFVIYIYSLQIV